MAGSSFQEHHGSLAALPLGTMDCAASVYAFLQSDTKITDGLRNILQRGTNTECLEALSAAALNSAFTESILASFPDLAIELCARWRPQRCAETLAAFARLVPSMPYLCDIAIDALSNPEDTNDLLGDLVFTETAHTSSSDNEPKLRESLLSVFRLLYHNNTLFAPLIKPAHLRLLIGHDDRSIRYLAIRIICLYIHASDAVLQDMISKYLGSDPIQGLWEGKVVDYAFLTLWEEERRRDLDQKIVALCDVSSSVEALEYPPRVISQPDLSADVIEVGGVLSFRKHGANTIDRDDEGLVLTPTTLQNLHKAATALCSDEPVLITGLAGAGKTVLVRHIAAQMNKGEKMVTLHLNEQSDAKLLVGIYTTGARPGSFKWQPGVLTTAVAEGRWVFIEDIDRAPDDIISTILPLVERRELFIPSQGETLIAAQGFKIIATMRSHKNLRGEEIIPGARLIGQRFWRRVELQLSSVNELQSIALARNPLLTKFMPRITAAYTRLTADNTISLKVGSRLSSRTRPISAREFLKWCDRVAQSLAAVGYGSQNDTIAEQVLDGIFLDAVDILAGNVEDTVESTVLTTALAEELHIDPQRRAHLLGDRTVQYSAIKKDDLDQIRVGRAIVSRKSTLLRPRSDRTVVDSSTFSLTRLTLRLLEQVSVAVQHREPLLLVGETGIGKTTAIQHLAQMLGRKLVAINLSQQSESGDLIGGFKPVNIRSLVIPLKDEFDVLFEGLFSHKKNRQFTEMLNKCIAKQQWKRTLLLWKEAVKMLEKNKRHTDPITGASDEYTREESPKRRKVAEAAGQQAEQPWVVFAKKVETLEKQLRTSSDTFSFEFVESSLIKAMRNGDWVLLDEINLAPPDTLESISDLLEGGSAATPSILLTETGNIERVNAHSAFRLFAAMNPATDVGKKDLPPSIRSRFTEIYVTSPDRDAQSLRSIVQSSLNRVLCNSKDRKIVVAVTDLYMDIQRLVGESRLVDGSNNRPHYSLRTLTRALQHAVMTVSQSTLVRAVYEGFSMCFSTCLSLKSAALLDQLIQKRLFTDARAASVELKKPLREPSNGLDYTAVNLEVILNGNKGTTAEQYWLPKGPLDVEDPVHYTVTPFVSRNLNNLIRAATTRAYPVLIQGPTSAGKTSMVEYLAKRSGNRFVRINNHEHTDLQEYLGTYVSDTNGKLLFQEGVLVQALRRGDWVVLDELNLAPSDVLEALNRLLDDNRELLIPETQEVVKPHPDFMLFATQNPVGPYGGRKMLSRAFRNRFLELHFDDIPVEELNIILAKRSSIPASWCTLIVEVYTRLSQLRQESRLFEQNSFATLRDLFRWALRNADTVEQLAHNGYMLLAEKVRKVEERLQIKQIIEQVMSRKGVKVSINDELLYNERLCPEMGLVKESGIVWTTAMRRLFVLVANAIRHNEAVLLVGETGCGKTTVCQMLAQAMQKTLHIINAHQNTETGDLIGAQRPIRNRAAIEDQLRADILEATARGDTPRNLDSADLDTQLALYDAARPEDKGDYDVQTRISLNRTKRKALFEWADGSLVQAMRQGDYYLLDEISLADDAVLERMNSVLDPQRSILLAEKGSSDSLVVAQTGFQFLATMNPGGDFGKKELSPALRNRFTEIWIPSITDSSDVLLIVQSKLKCEAVQFAGVMVDFARWFSEEFRSSTKSSISIRDVLAWIDFVNSQNMDSMESLVHGAAMVYIDSLGANPSALVANTGRSITENRVASLQKLSSLLGSDITQIYRRPIDVSAHSGQFSIGAFSMPSTATATLPSQFSFNATTPRSNAMRIVRALQLSKPILLEGNPGVGKTSIVSALATATGNSLTRINLSEQTDLMDLFGSDAPIEGAEAGQFAWRDAPFLTAMKTGCWVLLDEMNLASQSVLEGLNACLDHRAGVYITELDQTFACHRNFRLFAAQNPHHQGGGRKGLPASFVNRFTVVYADAYSRDDLDSICIQSFPELEPESIRTLVAFVSELDVQVSQHRSFGIRGSPWEFNLRDSQRWLQLLSSSNGLVPAAAAQDFLDMLFVQRFRSGADQQRVREMFEAITGMQVSNHQLTTNVTSRSFQLGMGFLPRANLISYHKHKHMDLDMVKLPLLETLMFCVQQSWPVLLVGPAGSGKSFLLEVLAANTGVKLDVFALSADVDATDLVGGYEQVDPSRRVKKFLRDLEAFVRTIIAQALTSSNNVDVMHGVQPLLNLADSLTSSGTRVVSTDLIQRLEEAQTRLNSTTMATLLDQAQELALSNQITETARFEWVDGVLVTALEEGRWLVLDNANLTSASVLDRLNSLLEPSGSLIVNEHSLDDGTARVIKPHPNFRIFLTMDPQYGEISRAMRNRAVEVFVPPREDTRTRGAVLAIESSTYRLRQLAAIGELARDDATWANSLEYAVRSLSFADTAHLESFCNQLRTGLFAESGQLVAEAIAKHLHAGQLLDFRSWMQAVDYYYKLIEARLAVSADFSFTQVSHQVCQGAGSTVLI